MKTRIAALSAVALLAASGCGGNESGGEVDASSAIAEQDARIAAQSERIDALESQLDELQQQQVDMQDQDEEEEGGFDPVEDDEAPESEQSSGGSLTTDSDFTALGEPAEVHGLLTGEYLGTVTINEIIPNFECPRDTDWEAETGAFMALNVTVENDAAASDSLRVFDSAFYLLDDEAQIHEPVAGNPATNACVADSELLPEPRPGGTASGLVIMDVAVESGVLVLNNAESLVHWEF